MVFQHGALADVIDFQPGFFDVFADGVDLLGAQIESRFEPFERLVDPRVGRNDFQFGGLRLVVPVS